jgi:hypothetical protein
MVWTCCKKAKRINEGMTYTKEEYKHTIWQTIMHCLNTTKLKHGVQWGYILSKGQCHWEKQWILTFTFHSLCCIIFEITVHNLRVESNYTSLPELAQRYSCSIWKIKIMCKLHFLCQKWKTLSEKKYVTFKDVTSALYQEIFPEFGMLVWKPKANTQAFTMK